MNSICFKQPGRGYVPVHAMGLLVTFISLALNVMFFIAIDRNSHSLRDTLIHFFIYFTCVSFCWRWMASKKS